MENTKITLSIMGGVVGLVTEQWVLFLVAVSIVVVADWITGIMKTKVTGEPITSKKGTVGFFKKAVFFASLGMGAFLDVIIPKFLEAGVGVELGFKTPFFLIIAAYIMFNELVSIAENIYTINPTAVPMFIIEWLKLNTTNIENTK